MTSLILDFRFTDNMVLIGWARRPTGMIVMAKDFLHAFHRFSMNFYSLT